MTTAKQRVILHDLFEKTPDGVIRHCGWTGPDPKEALTWVKEMKACFPDNCYSMRPICR